MKNLKTFLNDLNDKRHVKRLFKKYDTYLYNFQAVYEEIRDRVPYCTCEKKLNEYYEDMRYLKSVEAAWNKKADQQSRECAALREKIMSL